MKPISLVLSLSVLLLTHVSEAFLERFSPLDPSLKVPIERLNNGVKNGKGTVLVVVSSADSIPLKNGGSHETGYFLRELTDPLKEVLLAGYDVEFATPGGKTPVIDKNSLKLAWWGFPKVTDALHLRREALAMQKSIEFLNGEKAPQSLTAARARMKEYVGLLVPGGHAPMVDLQFDPDLGAIIRYFHEDQRPMAFVCHGPVALLSTGTEGGWPFAGYKITVVSQEDEKLLESNLIWPLIGKISGKLISYPDVSLAAAGAVLANSPVAGGAANFSIDREVITVQNPAGATAAGKILARSIEERAGQRHADLPVPGITEVVTLSDLAKMSSSELENLFSKGTAEKIPLGDAAGLGLIFNKEKPSTTGATLNFLSEYAWQGKVFRSTDAGVELDNKIFGKQKLIGLRSDAQVRLIEQSKFDGRPSILLDYSKSQDLLVRPVIDEIRKIGPNLYLGRVTFSNIDLGFFSLYFVD